MKSGLSLVILVVGLAVPVAQGQDAPSEETQALLREALSEYDLGHYAEAYSLFVRVHAAHPTARTERALGNTSFELRRYVEAVGWLESALADDRSPLTPEMRTEVEGVLSRARAFVGRYRITTNVEGASIEVDGLAPDGETVLLDVGDHEVVASAVGHATVTRHLAVRGGEDETLALTLRPTGLSEPSADDDVAHLTPPGGASNEPAPGGESVAESPWLWTILGVVVVGAAVGIGVGVAVGSGTTLEAPLVPPGGLVMALEGP